MQIQEGSNFQDSDVYEGMSDEEEMLRAQAAYGSPPVGETLVELEQEFSELGLNE